MTTLLEKAKAYRPRHRKYNNEVSREEMELAIAWISDEVNLTAVSGVLKKRSSSTVARLAIVLREAYRKGMLRIK